MNRLNIAIALIAVLALAGCMTTTAEAPVPSYAGVEREYVQWNGNTWRIYENEAAGRVLVTPNEEGVAASGLSGNSAPKIMRLAAQRYFYESGRNCEVGSDTLLSESAYEFPYSCEASTKSKRYCVTEAECRDFARRGFLVDKSFVGIQPVAQTVHFFKMKVFDDQDVGRALIESERTGHWTITPDVFEQSFEKHARDTKRQCEITNVDDIDGESKVIFYRCN
ncbi:hypothetical protein [Shimia sp. Alg240-R146]|uniref:hypothetical protein n=1 Tax=Shimia sp. Alg240-R146 TaxID=2993449 RepID=UPI0022E07FB4|nr:hypothetical protein [Shimia sp. Alg240-R146]